VSKTLSGETITCASCEYRYPPSERICPMCGTEPLAPLWAVPGKFSRADHESSPQSSDSQPRPARRRVWRLVPVVVILMAVMAVTSFYYSWRNSTPPKESSAGAERASTSEKVKLESAADRDIVRDPAGGVQHVAAGRLETTVNGASEQLKVENAGERDIVHDPVRVVQHVIVAKPQAAETANAAEENDPVELWKAVKRGSVSAEVALAHLYLEGKTVPQNCEQAHMLFEAASMKGSKAADDSLKSSYPQRCE